MFTVAAACLLAAILAIVTFPSGKPVVEETSEHAVSRSRR
jgi:hypothetical protein